MLELKISKSLNKKEWERLYQITPQVSPFFNLDAISIAIKYFYPYYLTRRCRPLFIEFYDRNIIRAILPLLKYSNGKIQLFGFANGFNESGFLFDSEDILPECFRIITEKFGSIELLKIDERSPIAGFAPKDAIVTSNAEISFGKDFNEYFKKLSKSVRQNIRTIYNRLTTDGLDYELKLYQGAGTIPIDDIISLYCLRHEVRYGVKTGIVKKWFLKSQSFATRFYRYAPNAMTFVLYIDQKPAAFLSGLYTATRLIVPRLSIDDEFKRYSPGMLLVIETIKYLENNTPINILDLSQGDESYKYKLGATEHLSYRFTLT